MPNLHINIKLKSVVKIPIKVIHVVCNPFDNIATMLIYKTSKLKISTVKQNNQSHEVDANDMQKYITKYFNFFQVIQEVKNKYNLNLLEVHGKDLIENPKTTILGMCSFLGVTCSDHYLEICTNKLYKTESKTRYKLKWSDQLISTVQNFIMNFDSLRRYHSFDS